MTVRPDTWQAYLERVDRAKADRKPAPLVVFRCRCRRTVAEVWDTVEGPLWVSSRLLEEMLPTALDERAQAEARRTDPGRSETAVFVRGPLPDYNRLQCHARCEKCGVAALDRSTVAKHVDAAAHTRRRSLTVPVRCTRVGTT